MHHEKFLVAPHSNWRCSADMSAILSMNAASSTGHCFEQYSSAINRAPWHHHVLIGALAKQNSRRAAALSEPRQSSSTADDGLRGVSGTIPK